MSPQSDDGPIKGVRWQEQTAIVDVQGDIDLRSSPQLQEELSKVLGRNPGKVVVNLSEVPYMDSSGVASLVKVLSRVKKESIPLVLVGLTDRVRSIFEITHLDTVFDIRKDEQEAIDES